jgi:hypothetical protein
MNSGHARYLFPPSAILCCFLSVLQGYLIQYAAAAQDGVRTFTGIVDEVLPDETPPIIMVKARPGMKDELVIGAVVRKGASIMRGKRPIALRHIRAGETITLIYVKNRDGLTARSITVESK